MQDFDLHVHSVFSDGKSAPEEIVVSAIEKGLKKIGFSDHSYTPCDTSYCMKRRRYKEYIAEISALKEKYADKIEVLCGIEQDYYSNAPTDCFDYVIGSVHYININGHYYAVDGSPKKLAEAADRHFGGDIYKVAGLYYDTVSDVVAVTHADIIGHFDLISKYNEKTPFFDPSEPRYVAAWKKAADKLLESNIPFEINYGAISRGVRTTPYPAQDIKEYIIANSGKFVLSSDSHHKDTIAFGFE